MVNEGKYVHYFHLYARTAMRKPVREYRFNDLESARVFVLRFLQKHAPGRNAEAIWAHISSEAELGPGHIVRGDMAKITCGFLLNFAEVGPYPSYLDDPACTRRAQFDGATWDRILRSLRPEFKAVLNSGIQVLAPPHERRLSAPTRPELQVLR